MAGKDPGIEQADAMAVFDQVMSAATPCTTAWEEVGLSNLRPSLDEEALAIAENQESSLESRRALAAQAKSFRLSVEAEIGATSDMRAASGALVRAFKSEIDALTTRSRFAEGAFLALYKLLREAPDPAVTVQALQRAARAAVGALEGQNRSLEEERLGMSHKLDAARAAAAARGGSLTAEELQEERRVIRAEVAADHAETEQSRLQALQDAVQEELLLAQGQAEQERAAAQAQQQVLQQEVERLEARAALVEEEASRAGQLEEEAATRAEQLRALQVKVDSLEENHEALAARAGVALEAEKKALADRAEAQARADSAERSAERRVRELEEEAARLRRQLEMGADAAQVEAMREKIRILEGIWGDSSPGDEAGAGPATSRGNRGQRSSEQDVGETPDQPDPDVGTTAAEQVGGSGGDRPRHGDRPEDSGGGGESEGKGVAASAAGGVGVEGGEAAAGEGREREGDAGVDAWLISYNRRLKGELERLRERTRQAEDRLKSVEEERVAEASELADRRQDVKRLEQDLVDAHQVVEAGKTMLRAFQSGPVAKQFGKLVGRGGGAAKGAGVDALEEDDYLEGMEDGVEGGDGGPGSEGFSAADRLLGAVKRQRERFRKEALRREREASIAKGNAEQLTRDNQDLRRENMHLYKKIRFVMSYGGKGDVQGDAGGDGERDTERKYEQLYEADLDPFKEFDSQEKEARRGQMGLVERWLFVASTTVLRNRFRRHLLVIYLLVLHGLLLVLPGGPGGGRGVPGIEVGTGGDHLMP
eukprot:g8535.t1